MPKDGNIKSPVVVPLALDASAHAPFLYFEDATVSGHTNGVIGITLEASRMIAADQGQVHKERVIVAHLRMNIPAALSLKRAIDAALLLASRRPSDSKN